LFANRTTAKKPGQKLDTATIRDLGGHEPAQNGQPFHPWVRLEIARDGADAKGPR